jgi:hypothetical protein
MGDPISGAIASAVANRAIGSIISAIENSEDPEKSWKQSGLELAIQAQAAYRQGIESGRLWDLDSTERKVNQFGEMAHQLAIRGELRGFDQEMIEMYENFAEECGYWADVPHEEAEEAWYESVDPIIENIKKSVNPN